MTSALRSFGLSLPDYPWEAMAPYLARAAEHPGGAVNLSIGTPVDATPDVVQEALRAAADAPGYPTVHGTPALREAIAAWFARRRGVPGLDPQDVMPTVGSKELVAWLPFLLGLKPGDVVVRPTVAYPTYDIGATFAGAEHDRRGRPRRARRRHPGPRAPGLGQLPGQPHRQRPRRRIAAPDRPAGPGARRRRGLGRVLRRTRLGRMGRPARRHSGAQHPGPAGCGGLPRGPAGRVLAEQAVQPGRLPRGLRGR